MSRPVDRVAELTEMLRKYWQNLVRFESSFKAGEDKRFYTLVRQCVGELLYEDEESIYPDWRVVKVWRPIRLRPGEAEQRIRGHVREWLRQARAAVQRWHATEAIDDISAFAEQWFGQATDPAQAAVVAKTPQTVEGRVMSVSSPRALSLRTRVAELESEKGDLEKQNAGLEAELARLRTAMQRMQKQLADSQFTVRNLQQQIAVLEKMAAWPPGPQTSPDRSDARMPATADMWGLLGRMAGLGCEA